MNVISFGLGLAVGYVVGTRRGRSAAEDLAASLKESAEQTWQREDVRSFVSHAADTLNQVTHEVAENARRFTEAAASFASQAAHEVETVIDEAESRAQQATSKVTDS